MTTCRKCGEEIQFREIDGRTVPLGCHCEGGLTHYFHRDETTRPTTCPKCQQRCFYIEHNGGCVWVDELGPPWPKHPCMDEEGIAARKKQVLFGKKVVDEIGTIVRAGVRTDQGVRVVTIGLSDAPLEAVLPAEFWRTDPAPEVGSKLGYQHDRQRLIRKDGESFSFRRVSLKICRRCGSFYLRASEHNASCPNASR